VKVLPMSLEIDDRIANELAGPMEGHVTAALDLEDLDALAAQKVRRCDEVFFLGRAAECDDGWMLDKEQNVLRDRAGDSVAGDIALQLQGLSVFEAAQGNRP